MTCTGSYSPNFCPKMAQGVGDLKHKLGALCTHHAYIQTYGYEIVLIRSVVGLKGSLIVQA